MLTNDELAALLGHVARPAGPAVTAGPAVLAVVGAAATAATTVAAREPSNGDAAFAAKYDPAAEARDFCRALLSPADRARVEQETLSGGFLSIGEVRDLVRANSVKESQGARGENCVIDPELMMQIDVRINYRIFVDGDNLFTRSELLANFPFEEFCTAPEEVFAQQEIGVFPPKKHALEGLPEFVARDAPRDGDRRGGQAAPDEFVMIEDLVGRAARRNHKTRRAPLRIVKTKIFLGKDRWRDFRGLQRLARSFERFVLPAVTAGGGGAFRALAAMPSARGATPGVARIAHTAVFAERETAVAALEERARALQQREADLRARETALCRALGIRGDAPDDAPAGDSVPL